MYFIMVTSFCINHIFYHGYRVSILQTYALYRAALSVRRLDFVPAVLVLSPHLSHVFFSGIMTFGVGTPLNSICIFHLEALSYEG